LTSRRRSDPDNKGNSGGDRQRHLAKLARSLDRCKRRHAGCAMPLTLLNEVICRLSDGEPKSAPYAGVWETSTLSPRRLADRIAGGFGSGVCPAPPNPTLVCILPPIPSHR